MAKLDTLGKRIKQLRESRGLKQNYVARKAGIGPSTLAGYESDFREPDIETLKNLVSICGGAEEELQWVIYGSEDVGQKTENDLNEGRKIRLDAVIDGIQNDVYVNDRGTPISEDLKIAIISILNAAKNK